MRLLLKFKPGIVNKPLIAETILETGALFDIERAKIESSQGEIVISISEDSCRAVADSLRGKGVEITRLDIPITKDEDNCIHCGACVSVCPVGATSYEYDWRVKMDEKVCVQCGTCVNACPVGVIRLSER